MYDESVHPANLWLDRDPGQHAEVDEIYRANIRRLVERGSYTLPAESFAGVRYIPAGDSEAADWSASRELWKEVDSSSD